MPAAFSTRNLSGNPQHADGAPNTPARLSLPGEYRAPEEEEILSRLIEGTPTVHATTSGFFPGDSQREAQYRMLGELGAPNIPALALLPARGWRYSLLSRTVAQLEGMDYDIGESGWRLSFGGSSVRSKDAHLARLSWDSDINMLADAAGRLSERAGVPWQGSLNLALLGPVSLGARMHLPRGEAVLSDRGAWRDTVDSMLYCLPSVFARLREALDAAHVPLNLELIEPDLLAAHLGSIRSSSGYSRVRSVPMPELEELYARYALIAAEHGVSLSLNVDGNAVIGPSDSALAKPGLDAMALYRAMSGAVATAEAAPTVDSLPNAESEDRGVEAPEMIFSPDRASTSRMSAAPLSDARRWESAVALLEAGARLRLPVVDHIRDKHKPASIPQRARALYSMLNAVGADPALLSRISVSEENSATMTELSIQDATATLARSVEFARVLTEIAAEA
ncbi:MAG: hypothetical protein Q4P78_02765 [Rothia sp. (in: high G+C Gram-positive bacteria)]|uniref:hypothetical protein n=1 Tax=Rothia sp. (in: high G+C Gram-positive bacteria) TaxID=1885016 RepID=UPI0026DFA9DE|nr:hypothetical protein [Rothia sp. (in: high G+C Gram-positive bacteria)]MDO5750111.1 hypothetical protein [Rothia sp. (in: high G+C Gram-positive bacteria)]